MTVLQRTDLTTSQKIQCAAAAVAGQHAHGSKTALSERYEISRPTVYAVGAAAQSVLRSHFESPLLQGAAVDVRVDDAQLRRAVVALRVLAPNAIRPIEDLVPLLYPGVKVSYGTIQHMLVEAEGRAARFNAQVSLGGVEAGALDEMFSQGEPVLAGVDLDSGYLFGLSLSATRDGEAWAGLLREGQAQGLGLSVVVKDAAKGIAAGVSEVFPRAEQRDDCFHVLYEMNKVRRRMERRAYAAIEREGEALGRLGKIRAYDKERRHKAKRELSSARRGCAEAIERFDAFEAALDTLRGALECVDIHTGELQKWTPRIGQCGKWNLPRVSGCQIAVSLVEVHRIRGASVQCAVTAPGVVEAEVAGETCPKLGGRFVGTQVHVLVLDAAPQTLDEHVVHPSALAIHADRNGVALEHVGERLTGELGPLVGIEDLRRFKAL